MKKILLVSLFLLAFLERTTYDLGPNIELVTMAMVLASFYLGRKQAFWLTLVIMATTDRVIGNTSIFLFTWSGFLIPALLISPSYLKIKNYIEHVLKLKLKRKSVTKIFLLPSFGLASNIFFFLWTNFGVWLLDSWNMYPKTLAGLIMSYINGLPFLRNQLISCLIFIPLGIFVVELSKLTYRKFSSISASFYRKGATF